MIPQYGIAHNQLRTIIASLAHANERVHAHNQSNFPQAKLDNEINVPFLLNEHDYLVRIGSCLACLYRVMDARGKFGEHERSLRVARGAAESNSSFLSALQTSQVHP